MALTGSAGAALLSVVPVTPGGLGLVEGGLAGLGLVEGGLAAALATGSTTASRVAAAVIGYRVLSYGAIVLAGVTALLLGRRAQVRAVDRSPAVSGYSA